MLARLRKAQENNEGGFTLIELLVVMIIIGILAAIAIPAFLNQKTKAKETSAKSDATNISKDFAAALVDGELTSITYTFAGGFVIDYADTNLADVTLAPNTAYKLTTGNAVMAAGGQNSNFCISVQAHKSVSSTGVPSDPIGTAWIASNNGLKKGGTCNATTGVVS